MRCSWLTSRRQERHRLRWRVVRTGSASHRGHYPLEADIASGHRGHGVPGRAAVVSARSLIADVPLSSSSAVQLDHGMHPRSAGHKRCLEHIPQPSPLTVAQAASSSMNFTSCYWSAAKACAVGASSGVLGSRRVGMLSGTFRFRTQPRLPRWHPDCEHQRLVADRWQRLRPEAGADQVPEFYGLRAWHRLFCCDAMRWRAVDQECELRLRTVQLCSAARKPTVVCIDSIRCIIRSCRKIKAARPATPWLTHPAPARVPRQWLLGGRTDPRAR